MEDLISRSYKLTWLIVGLVLIVMLLPSSSYAAGFDIVRDGQGKMVIVIPDEAVSCVQRAAEELKYYVKEASGATLEIVSESDSDQTGQGRIYLGACKAAKQAGVCTDRLTRNGFIIKVVGSDLFLAGRDTAYSWTAYNSPAETGTLLAVYNFLDRQMGVRWLWPGKLGEVVPKALTISIGKFDETVVLPLKSTRIHPSYIYQLEGWFSDEARKRFVKDECLWEQRHYFSWDTNLRSKHSFGEYWNRFGKTHPQYFNVLPDGTRRSDPYYVGGGNPKHVSMCVSEPSFWHQIVEDWKKNRTKLKPNLFIGENDTAGKCCCPRCMSWDVPDPKLDIPWEKRLDYARDAFAKGDAQWFRYLGSLSDRYAKFYMEVLKLARQTDPNVLVSGFSYANYVSPPLRTKLDDHIVIHFVGPLMYPWTPTKVQQFKDDWESWADTGCNLILRPNFMLDGHCMPIFFARKFADIFSCCYQQGMIGTEFDSNTGQYATQGPNMYVMARMNIAINKPVDEILDEYYGAFGPAEAAVREYFAMWEGISGAATDETCRKATGHGIGAEIGGWSRFFSVADLLFTPDVMVKAQQILERAAKTAKDDTLVLARVNFLQKGLKHATMTLATQKAYEQYEKDKNTSNFAKAVRKLDEYRASIENDNVSNMAFLAYLENRVWSRSSLAFLLQPGEDLPKTWKFLFDPDNEGLDKKWYSEKYDDSKWFDIGVDSCWEEQPIGKQWELQHGKQYNGFGWYRNRFTVPSSGGHKKIQIAFGAVDEACKIWINGNFVLDRPFPYKGDHESWHKTFEIDITEYIRYDQPNVLAVRVEDNSGAGGIGRLVKLLISEGK